MHKYRSKCRWNMLLQLDGEVIEIRPGEIFESSAPVDSRYLEEMLPPKPTTRTKKSSPKKKFSLDGSSSTQTVSLTDDSWSEASTTWNTRPATGTSVGSRPGDYQPNTRYSIPLDPTALQSSLGGNLNLTLTSGGSDNFWFRSSEASTGAPELQLDFTPAVPDDEDPGQPGTPSTSVTGSTVTLTWSPATDNVGVLGYDVHRGTSSSFTPSGPSRSSLSTARSTARVWPCSVTPAACSTPLTSLRLAILMVA